MKNPVKYFNLFIITILLAFGKVVVAQDSIHYNSIKTIISPVIGGDYFGALAMFGYERNISPHIAVGMNIRTISYGASCSTSNSLSFLPSVTYFTISKHPILNSFWVGIYGVHHRERFSDCSCHYDSKYFGLGFMAGKRTWFSKKHHFFFDMGCGATYLCQKYYHYSSLVWDENGGEYCVHTKNPDYYWLPRPIINFGWRL